MAAQALLLGTRLDLLPLWDDERYTLQTAARPPAGIIEAVRVDVHPPLYYFLVHAWLKLPLAGDDLTRARALSVILTLSATLALYVLWLRQLSLERRALFLALWVSSPCLVLYARMARSYAFQLVLAVIAIRLAQDWLRRPGSIPAMARYAAAAAALLYTHYLPGLAVVASTAALGLWRRQWKQLAALAVIALAYLPWIGTLASTAGLVSTTKPYWLGANAAVENLLKLSYAFVAFNFGETISPWAAAAAVLLLPAIAVALWKAWTSQARPPALFLLVAAAGYFVAASWVSFAFVGARLLFLLPFYYLFLLRGIDPRRPAGAVALASLLLVASAGLASYYRKQDFLNKGYLVDFQQLAQLVQEKSRGAPALVLLDRHCSSAGYYLHWPGSPYRVELLDSGDARRRALDRLHLERPSLVWRLQYSRTARDPHLEHELSNHYTAERYGFVPYSWLDRKALQVLGAGPPPDYVVEAIEFRRR